MLTARDWRYGGLHRLVSSVSSAGVFSQCIVPPGNSQHLVVWMCRLPLNTTGHFKDKSLQTINCIQIKNRKQTNTKTRTDNTRSARTSLCCHWLPGGALCLFTQSATGRVWLPPLRSGTHCVFWISLYLLPPTENFFWLVFRFLIWSRNCFPRFCNLWHSSGPRSSHSYLGHYKNYYYITLLIPKTQERHKYLPNTDM